MYYKIFFRIMLLIDLIQGVPRLLLSADLFHKKGTTIREAHLYSECFLAVS